MICVYCKVIAFRASLVPAGYARSQGSSRCVFPLVARFEQQDLLARVGSARSLTFSALLRTARRDHRAVRGRSSTEECSLWPARRHFADTLRSGAPAAG